MLNLLHLDLLREGKVLLAFSGGVDSTALFHLLLKNHIAFDIAHVNYHTRSSSDEEAQNAHNLANLHHLECYIHDCRLEKRNFEHHAREERYRFFEYLMQKHPYTYLLTAHQLNDRLEWLMMQLCKGAGLPELLGIRSHDRRNGIEILRPLLEHDRQSIEDYLEQNLIPHFIDQSNSDEYHTRNLFRHRFSTPMMRQYAQAIRKSFRYLEEDNSMLIENVNVQRKEKMFYFTNPKNRHSLIIAIDTILKSLGHIMRGAEKEFLKENHTLVVGRLYLIWIDTDHTFIAPYILHETMSKEFKEVCRKAKIEPKMRGYLATHPESCQVIPRLKDALTPLRCD